MILDGANLANPGGTALGATQITVDRDMCCREGFTATGRIELDDAHIGKQLTLADASLTDPDTVLSAANLTVTQDVSFGIGFTAVGEISLPGARIGGDLDLAGASLANPAGFALNIKAASIQRLHMPQRRPDGKVDLTNAKVGDIRR